MQPVIKPTALIIDDTEFLKDGGASACVSPQYTGTAGKVTNCQAGVSLHLASNNASAAVNWRLFLPESWDPAASKADPTKVARRTSCAVPAELGHVEKWQLALDMIDETRSWGVDVPQDIADGGYGDTAAFRLRLGGARTRIRGGHLDHDHRAVRGGTTVHRRLHRPGPTAGCGLSRAGPAGEGPGHRGGQGVRPAGAVA